MPYNPVKLYTTLFILYILLRSGFTKTSADPNDPQECLDVDEKANVDGYQGKLSVAYDGTECSPWIQNPHFWRSHWSQERAVKESNYCRNPDNDKRGPWCVVHKSSFKYCNVPRCAKDVGCYEDKGENYAGHQDRTIEGLPCRTWINADISATFRYRFRLYENESYSTVLPALDKRVTEFSACRNPGGSSARPWCYTTSQSGIKNGKSHCDIPSCSDPSVLGYPLLEKDRFCATDFVEQVHVVSLEGKREAKMRYCIAPEGILHPAHRKQPHNLFNDFCLFLVGKSMYCPAGFRRVQRFQPMFTKMEHVSGPSVWRLSGENLIHTIYCCSDPNYFKDYTPKPYVLLEKISAYKLDTRRPVPKSLSWVNYRKRDMIGDPIIRQPVIHHIVEIVQLNMPIFASIRHCPPVADMVRHIIPSTRNRVDPDEDPNDPLSSLFEDILCEYYPMMPSKKNETCDPHRTTDCGSTTKESSSSPNRTTFALIVYELSCPPGYELAHSFKELLLLFGTSVKLCIVPTDKPDPEPITHSENGYCLVVAPVLKAASKKWPGDAWKQASDFSCPKGFRPNEFHFYETGNRLKLCCTGALNNGTNGTGTGTGTPTTEASSNSNVVVVQTPFGAKPPFTVMMNGHVCPSLHADSDKLNVVQYKRSVSRTIMKKLTLIGLDDPLLPSDNFAATMCQYVAPNIQLAVKSRTFSCEGLGQPTSVMYGGATCAFELNEGMAFPPGKYCLFLVTTGCPPGFTQRSGVVRLGTNLQPLGNLCCRNEESIGAIRLPVKLQAPFKLPALQRPCQAFENFNVDAELHYCVYYPQGTTPQSLLMWPRVVGKKTFGNNKTESLPVNCAVSFRKVRTPHQTSIDRLMIYFNLMYDQWLTQKRPRWISGPTDTGDVCFNEVHASLMPSTTNTRRGYCVFVFGVCPKQDFEMLGASPYMNSVLCCTISQSGNNDRSSRTEHDDQSLRSFVTLGRATAQELVDLRGFYGTKLLDVGSNATLEACPKFQNLQLRRRVVEGHRAPTNVRFDHEHFLTRMFNVTHMTDDEFKQRTGIWTYDNIAYTHYCEYALKGSESSSGTKGTNWPIGNYALPKPVSGCPKNSVASSFHHRQDEFGFHYSQPIHLDGLYLQGQKGIWLEYCVFTSSGADRTQDELPPGHYCVLRVRGECPSGFSEGLLSMLEGPQKANSDIPENVRDELIDAVPEQRPLFDIRRQRLGVTDKSFTIDKLDYHFCCRTDSPGVDMPIQGFPKDTGAFYLYRVGDQCQQVEGMRVTEEFVCMDTPNRGDSTWSLLDRNQSWSPYTVKGLTPARIPFHSHCDVEIKLCFYEKDVPETEITEVNVHNPGQWPIGSYALPNSHRADDDLACPPGFTQNHMSLITLQATFYDLEIVPTVLGSYFLELLGHNHSALTVHYCERNTQQFTGNLTENATLPPQVSAEQLALQWPKGEYCVISTDLTNHCPPGLHRHTRSVAELCCRSDKVKNPTPVDWPFIGDFFLFGGETCLPIKNTHIEKYAVRLLATHDAKKEAEWDVLCHYVPLEWLQKESKWPNGDYMLPIGRRSGLKSSMVYLAQYTDDLTNEDITTAFRRQQESSTAPVGRYLCPETFQRARFTFVSKNVEKRLVSSNESDETSEFNVVALTAMEFCIRENASLHNTTTGDEEWPKGDYCVFTMNQLCPAKMHVARETALKIPNFLLKSVDLVDEFGEPIGNKHWHEEANNHLVYFMQCCRQDHNLMLRLPKSRDGYYLARSSILCSIIPGTLLDQETVTTYLTSPHGEKTRLSFSERYMSFHRDIGAYRDGMMHLCYYHPGKGFDYSMAVMGNAQPFTTVNMTLTDIADMAKICGCAKNAVCLPGRRAECVCLPGFFGDGRHICSPVTPLTDGCANLCDQEAVCMEKIDPLYHGKSHTTTSHFCICRPGYLGDGFICQPSCAVRGCQPFSRCVPNMVRGTTECECIEGTVPSDGRCNLDLFKSLMEEKDLPQFLLHHDHCLSEETKKALHKAKPDKFFYVFVPEKLLTSCAGITAHLVVRDAPLTDKMLQKATADSPIWLVTENNTRIEIYPQNGSWVIDGYLAQSAPVKFVNAEMYTLSGPLKLTPHTRIPTGPIILSLVIIFGVLIILGVIYVYRKRLLTPILAARSRVLHRRIFWRNKGESVLVEEPDNDE